MDAKKAAAEKAVSLIQNGMVVGLGTGSTAYWAIQKIGERAKEGLSITAVATSLKSEALAQSLGIPMADLNNVPGIDIAIDGADEVDVSGNLIKGGGGALLREKMVAFHSRHFLVVVDSTKLVTTLGHFPLPVEITPFAAALTLQSIKSLGCEVALRKADSELFITDNNNLIADCNFSTINDPVALQVQLKSIPGVLETGLFMKDVVHTIFVGSADGSVQEIQPHKS